MEIVKAHAVKPHILLIEDYPLIIRIHRRFLESMNCTVIVAENGHQALELHSQKPALILLDIGLPDMSGINVCQRIRQQETKQRTPIIALTAFGGSIEQECRAAGADDFALKPIKHEELYRLLCFWLPQYRSVIKPMQKLAVVS